MYREILNTYSCVLHVERVEKYVSIFYYSKLYLIQSVSGMPTHIWRGIPNRSTAAIQLGC